jgi:hypothetical protein
MRRFGTVTVTIMTLLGIKNSPSESYAKGFFFLIYEALHRESLWPRLGGQ